MKTITLGQARPGDIIRLHPGHVRSYDRDSWRWYRNESCAFVILSLAAHGKDTPGGIVWDDIACWPVCPSTITEDAADPYRDTCGIPYCFGQPALRFIERDDTLCERLGNICEMMPDGWGDGCSLPFDKRREQEPESEGES